MSRKVTVMNEVNNFASVKFGHCGKSKQFTLNLGIYWAVPLRILLGFTAKCLDFPQCPDCPQITYAQLLTSPYVMCRGRFQIHP